MTRIKFCGLTRADDVAVAVDLGVDALGFVLWPGSPRAIAVDAAAQLIAGLPESVTPVGVFVRPTRDEIARAVDVASIRVAQIHGTSDVRDLTDERWELWVAAADAPADTTMFLDAYDPERHGGTGRTIDWDAAGRIAAERRVMLAGGLTPENVAEAIRRARPYGVDVSSGIEDRPGVKNAAAMRAFVKSVRSAELGSANKTKMNKTETTTERWFGRRDPDRRGYFGDFGGRFVPETLVAPIQALEQEYLRAREDPSFSAELERLFTHYAGRPTPLWNARRLREECGGPRIFLKREDLTHTGAHKINNALGQALLAVRIGKKRIVAETGAGQHGVASATACALLGLECVVYMGSEDMARQALNVFRMRLLGAEVRSVEAGSRTLKDAINEAMRDWVGRPEDTHYLLGSALGPHPYPLMVREFQSVIGREAKAQFLEQTGCLPDAVIACVGGGSNAIGIFDAFIEDAGVRLIGVEAGGESITPGRHAARFAGGSAGVLQGTRTFVLQDDAGNIELTHSVSAGLDYAAVGPEHAWLHERGRAEYYHVSDDEAVAAFQQLARLEGILPALESSHAIAYVLKTGRSFGRDATLLVNLSGRGDKDVQTVEQKLKGTEREPH